MYGNKYHYRSLLALLTEVEASLLFFGNTTFKYRHGLGEMYGNGGC
jgi:hypothetical protein